MSLDRRVIGIVTVVVVLAVVLVMLFNAIQAARVGQPGQLYTLAVGALIGFLIVVVRSRR